MFLDLSALYRLFLDKKELSELLSEKLASKNDYVTSPIVVQELIFSIYGLEELVAQLDLEQLEKQVELVPLNYDNIEAAFRENRHDERSLAIA